MPSLRCGRPRASVLVLAVLLGLLPGPAGAQIDKLLKGLGQGGQGSGLSDAKMAPG